MTEFEIAAMRELAGIRTALERIAGGIEAITAPEPPAMEPGGCLHPVEDRTDFGVTDGVEDWQCGKCGYRSIAEPVEGAPV